MSGSFSVTTNNGYISGHVDWSESNISTANNTSTVTATMYLSRTNSGYTSYGTDNFYVTINGTQINSGNESYSLTYNSNTVMVSGSVTVTHNSDGTKSINIGWGGGGGSGGVFTVNSGSGNATLSTIARASTVSSSVNWTAGTQNLGITLQVHDSSFHHSIQVFVGDTESPVVYGSNIGQRDNIGNSYTWIFSQSEITQTYQKISGYENRPVIVRVFTYDSGGSQIGSYQDTTGTVNAVATATVTIGTGNTFNIGSNPTYNIASNYVTGATGGFTYDFVFTLGSFTKTFSGNTAQTGTLTFTSTDINNMYAATTNSNSLTGTVRCRTNYNGVSTEDGLPASDTTNITATVTGSNPIFSASPTYQDNNSTISGITGNNQYIVQNQSDLMVMLNCSQQAMGQNGATISSYTCTVNGITVQQSNNGPTTAPTLSLATNAGSLLPANTTYYVVYTWTLSGSETFMSPEASINVPSGATDNLVVTVPSFPANVTAANVYIGTVSNTETKQGTITTSAGTYTQSSTLASGSAMPMMMFDMGKVNSSTANTIVITAIDSRGNRTSVTQTYNLVAYSPPQVTTTSTRASGFDVAVTTTCSGSYSLVNVGGNNKNSIVSAQYQFKKSSAGSYPTTGAGSPTAFAGLSASAGTFSATSASPNDGTNNGLDNTVAWNIQVIVVDSFGNTATYLTNSSNYNIGNTVATNTIVAGIPVMFVDTTKKSVGVGAFPAYNNILQIGSVAASATPTNLMIGNWSNAASGGAQIIGGWQGSQYWGIGTNSNSSTDLTLKIGNTNNSGAWQTGTNIDLTIAGGLNVFNGSANTSWIDQTSATMPATAGWYRFATTTASMGNSMAEFEITCASSGYHTQAKVIASIQYGQSPVLSILSSSQYSNTSLTQIRMVYDTTYSGNYAYLEIYLNATNQPVTTVRMFNNNNWSLMTPTTAGSQPGGYTTIVRQLDSGIYSENVVSYGSNSNGTYIRYASGLQICWQTWSYASTSGMFSGSAAFPNVTGDYYMYISATWTFPSAFNATPAVTATGDFSGVYPEHHSAWCSSGSSASVEDGVLWQSGFDINTHPALTRQAMAIGTWR